MMRSVSGERYRTKWSGYAASVRLAVVRMLHVEDLKPKPVEGTRHKRLGIAPKVNRKAPFRRFMRS